jgi:hypothetical protein
MWVKWKFALVCLETVLVLASDRRTVCSKCSMGTEILLAAPDDLLGHVVQKEARFGPFGYSVNLHAR